MSPTPSGLTVQVSSLFRAYLNLAGVPWKQCEELGERFNYQIEECGFISTDRGFGYELYFVPKRFDHQKEVINE